MTIAFLSSLLQKIQPALYNTIYYQFIKIGLLFNLQLKVFCFFQHSRCRRDVERASAGVRGGLRSELRAGAAAAAAPAAARWRRRFPGRRRRRSADQLQAVAGGARRIQRPRVGRRGQLRPPRRRHRGRVPAAPRARDVRRVRQEDPQGERHQGHVGSPLQSHRLLRHGHRLLRVRKPAREKRRRGCSTAGKTKVFLALFVLCDK
jgi:hypothetical protein